MALLRLRRSLPYPLSASLYPILYRTRIFRLAPVDTFLTCPYPVRRNASSTNSKFSTSNSLHAHPPSPFASLLRDYGFTPPQISSLANRISKFNVEAILLSNLNFFTSIGFSHAQLHKLVYRCPWVLSASLQDRLIPCIDFLRGVPLNDSQIVQILNWYPVILSSNIETVLTPNLCFLRDNRVNQLSIRALMLRFTPTLCRDHVKFKTFFDYAVQSGLCPSTNRKFVDAMHTRSCQSKDSWDRKIGLFKRYGLGDESIAMLLQREPIAMGLSEKNLERRLEFFTNKLNCSQDMIVRNPRVLLCSFEKRVRPRCTVMEKLVEMGLSRRLSPATYLKFPDEKFLERFIHGHKEVMPELLELYDNAAHSSSCRKDDV